MSAPVVANRPGYYGKVPSRGDFIGEGLPPELLEPWSEWLQSVIAVSREQLADRWLEYYLASPIWHFALSAGVCGDSPCAGVLLPSVDSVGRHFPFTLLAPVTASPVQMQQATAWFDTVEGQALAVLDDGFSLADWNDMLLVEAEVPAKIVSPWRLLGQNNRRLAWLGERPAADDQHALLDHAMRQQLGRYSLWWTQGSDDLPPSTLAVEGLPPVGMFAAMMDGGWERPCS